MKRFFAKIGRFFWSRGFLKFVLWTVTIVILFYAEEDWRGARAWAATKAGWEAKGESFDYNRLVPSPVPDDENLAAIPLFKLDPDPDPEDKGHLAPLTLQKALRHDLPGNDINIPGSGNWEAGQVPDMGKIREAVAANYAEAFKNVPPPSDALAQFDALYPFIADLRAAAASRPYCRFPQEYPQHFPDDIFLRMTTIQIQMAKVLNLHAVLALDAHKPDLALDDIKANFKLISGVRQESYLVSGLVAIGMTAIDFTAVYDGLALHSWNDAQLADLESELSRMDFLSDYQRCLRGEIGIAIPAYDNLMLNRFRRVKTDRGMSQAESESRDFFPDFWATGWIELWKVRVVNIDLTAVSFVDPKVRLVRPQSVGQFTVEAEQDEKGWKAFAPWNMMSVAAAGPVANAVTQFARIQVWIDEARIACALERYRLAHGVYADSLDALAPAYIDELPHDIFNGQPYHYQLRPDGTFLLYSVGWNQADDGGKVVYKKDSPQLVDYKKGDWVWPTPQFNPQEPK